jgi:hypothetical protein
MRVVIKGSKRAALGALVARGITRILSIEEDTKWNHTYVHVSDNCWLTIQRWFCSAGAAGAPYPEGECLFYSHTKVGGEL